MFQNANKSNLANVSSLSYSVALAANRRDDWSKSNCKNTSLIAKRNYWAILTKIAERLIFLQITVSVYFMQGENNGLFDKFKSY